MDSMVRAGHRGIQASLDITAGTGHKGIWTDYQVIKATLDS